MFTCQGNQNYHERTTHQLNQNTGKVAMLTTMFGVFEDPFETRNNNAMETEEDPYDPSNIEEIISESYKENTAFLSTLMMYRKKCGMI